MPASQESRRRGGSPQRGAALVIALLVMAALLLLGTTFLTISTTETEIANNARDATQAFYIAETGLARLKRDLLSQFAVPYRALCSKPGDYADLTRKTLTSGESLGVPGQQVDRDGKVTCSPPGSTAYYPLLDFPVGPTWILIPYGGGGGGGSYRVEVRNATRPNAIPPQLPNTIEAQVTATTGAATGASRQFQARFQVDRFSPTEHALFVDGGIWRSGGQGRMVFAGPVFVKGWSPSFQGIRLGDAGIPDQIVNYYKDIDPTLYGAITPPVVPAGQDLSLNATLRVYQGPVQILNSLASVGEPTVQGNGLKESLNGVYTSQGFTGAPGPANVYSDNGAGARFDLPRELVTYPDLNGPYTGPPLGVGTEPSSHDAFLRGGALSVDGSLTIDSTTAKFSIPPKVESLAQCDGNCLIYRPRGQGKGAAASWPILAVKGIIWVKGDINLGGSGANRLDGIQYEGSGTLYARTGSFDENDASIRVTADLMPPAGFQSPGESGKADKFPADHSLGLISAGWVRVGESATGAGGQQSPPPPTLRIAASIFANYSTINYWPYQIAGSVMSRFFYVGEGARVYYVPALTGARPPGMPGVTSPKAGSPYFVRTLSWRDIMP